MASDYVLPSNLPKKDLFPPLAASPISVVTNGPSALTMLLDGATSGNGLPEFTAAAARCGGGLCNAKS